MNFGEMQKFLDQFEKSNKEATSSIGAYLGKANQVLIVEREIVKQKKLQNQLYNDIADLVAKGGANLANLTQAEKNRLKVLKEAVKAQDDIVFAREQELVILKDSSRVSNAILATGKSIGKAAVWTFDALRGQTGELLAQMKAIRATEKNMGILSSQARGFRANIEGSAGAAAQMGIDTAGLAAIQNTYSDELGRAVVLSGKSLIAISEISAGTGLSVENAAAFAAGMDSVGISAERSRDIIGDTVTSSGKMGLNSTVVLKKLEASLKMANKYHFNGGVDGMKKMAQNAARFKIEMESVGSVADKLFDPEGAIEMSAQLQVLGGAWSQISDPFQLMFKARNDLGGLQNDLIKAASGAAVFNSKTKEFEIPALELARMREVAKATGLSMDELAESAKRVATEGKIKAQIRGLDDPKLKEFVAVAGSLKDGKGVIRIDGKEIGVGELGKYTSQLKVMMKDDAGLAERAEQGRLFDDSWNNGVMQLKATLLPFMEKINGALKVPLEKFTAWMAGGGFKIIADKMEKVGTVVADVFTWFFKHLEESPIATIGLSLAAMGIFKVAEWVLYGAAWRSGAGINALSGLLAKTGGGASSSWAPGQTGPGGASGVGGLAQTFKGNLGGAGAITGGLLAGAFSAWSEWTENKSNKMSAGENVGRTSSKGLGAGLGAWGGAAAGAAIGSVVPVLGTVIGGLIGGALGAWGGSAAGEATGDAIYGNEKVHQDFIARPGADPISFSSADTLVGLKKDGGIGKALVNNATGNGNSGGSTTVNFSQPLEIRGEIKLTSSSGTGSIDMNNPILIRELSRIIQEELSKSIGGGKISSNPIA